MIWPYTVTRDTVTRTPLPAGLQSSGVNALVQNHGRNCWLPTKNLSVQEVGEIGVSWRQGSSPLEICAIPNAVFRRDAPSLAFRTYLAD